MKHKFRGWDTVAKKITTDFAITADGEVIQHNGAEMATPENKIIPMQLVYTNPITGQEFYEGDVIKSTPESITPWIIENIMDAAVLMHDGYFSLDAILIGNIYETESLRKYQKCGE